MTREYSLYMARLSGQSNRFDEMMEYMRQVVKFPGVELNSEERILFNHVCENLIDSRRKPLEYMTEHLISDNNEYIINNLSFICSDIIKLIDDFGLPNSSSVENMVNYYQMMGDCFKCLAEIQPEQKYYAVDVEGAYRSYLKAYNAAKNLHGADPTRVAVALKFSTFYYTVLKTPWNALAMAKAEYVMAAEMIEELPESLYREVTIQLRSLHDKICVWEQEDRERQVDLQLRLNQVASRTIVSPCLRRGSLTII